MEDITTTDLSKYGYKELDEAAKLLQAYADNGVDFLGDNITLNFNTNSGKVFLSDEDYNVGVLEDTQVVQFYSCPNCGNEGTQYEAKDEGWDFEKFNGACSKKCQKALS